MSESYNATIATNSAVLALSKLAWTIGLTLSKLSPDTKCPGLNLTSLADDIKVLGNECDQIYVESADLLKQSISDSDRDYNVDDNNIWGCLAQQIAEVEQVIRQVETFTSHVNRKIRELAGQIWEEKRAEKYREHLARLRTNVCKHTTDLHTTLELIRTVLAYRGHSVSDREYSNEMAELQAMTVKLQVGTRAEQNDVKLPAETDQGQCTQKGVGDVQSPQQSPLAQQFFNAMYDIDGRIPFHLGGFEPHGRSGNFNNGCQPHDTGTSSTMIQENSMHPVLNESDQGFLSAQMKSLEDPGTFADDLNADLVAAALGAGMQTFDAEEWDEAEAFFEEAFQTLSQLSSQQRARFDTFAVRFKVAVCAFHARGPTAAVQMLADLVKQPVHTDEQHKTMSDVQHLLSLLYVRLRRMELARTECESALLTRRRFCGKDSNEAFESTALLAHIHLLSNNRTRAKSYLAIIPQGRREMAQKSIEKMLGTNLDYDESSPQSMQSSFGGSETASQHRRYSQSVASFTSSVDQDQRNPGLIFTSIEASPVGRARPAHLSRHTSKIDREDNSSTTSTSYSMTDGRTASVTTTGQNTISSGASNREGLNMNGSSRTVNQGFKELTSPPLSRREILQRIGRHPRDDIEQAVCDGDRPAFDRCLSKKKDFWRSKLRKHTRAERVTALHFAALFDEFDMAQRLIASSYNVNEVPHGYSTTLTPLTFAIGARQVRMTELLLDSGARPVQSETSNSNENWGTLAGKLLNKSWLYKTLSDADKPMLSSQAIAIFKMLLRYGWNVNDVVDERSRRTVLHQAVEFHTGSHQFDMNVRTAIVTFLYGQGSNPLQVNREGKTARQLATDANHQDILRIFDGDFRVSAISDPSWPIELPV